MAQIDKNPKKYILKVTEVDITVVPGAGRKDEVEIQFQGNLTRRTRDRISHALRTENYSMAENKHILA